MIKPPFSFDLIGGFFVIKIMAENKKSFVLYADLLKSIEHLTNEEKGILFNHLLEYVNDKQPILTDRLILTAWKPIELQLKRDLVKFEEVKTKRSDAGKRSAELRQLKSVEQSSTNPTLVKSVEHRLTNPTENVNVNDTVNENVNVNDTVNENVNVNDILLKKETKNKYSFKNEMLKYGFEPKLVDEWLLIRKNKKATNTETAFKNFIAEIEKRECNINEVMKEIISRSWSGFKWQWLEANKIIEKNTTENLRKNLLQNGIPQF